MLVAVSAVSGRAMNRERARETRRYHVRDHRLHACENQRRNCQRWKADQMSVDDCNVVGRNIKPQSKGTQQEHERERPAPRSRSGRFASSVLKFAGPPSRTSVADA